MAEHVVSRVASSWLTRKEAFDALGLTRSNFRRLVAAGVLRSRGRGAGQRFEASTVHAAGVLWEALDALLPPAKPE